MDTIVGLTGFECATTIVPRLEGKSRIKLRGDKMGLARRMLKLGTETAFEMLAKAKALEAQGRDVVHLEIGEPDFDTPAHIVAAAVEALHQGYTHYGPAAGLAELREAIARNVAKTRGISVQPDQVIVTPGAKPIMFFTILALAQRGREVIYPNPGFPIYESMIRYCGAKPVPMRLLEERGYHPDLEDLALKINSRTSLVILNSPHNPTGSMLYPSELAAIADQLRGRDDVVVLSDEIYKDIIYPSKGSNRADVIHQSIASLPGMADKTIILDGLSKSYAMTGWRLGYGVFPQRLVPPITRLISNSVSCAASFAQRAAISALEGPQDEVRDMVKEFQRRRDLIVDGLQSIPGISCPRPEGAFYAFPSIKDTGIDSHEFQERALTEAGVALLDGQSFGRFGKGFVRVSYANSQENLTKAVERLAAFVAKASKRRR